MSFRVGSPSDSYDYSENAIPSYGDLYSEQGDQYAYAADSEENIARYHTADPSLLHDLNGEICQFDADLNKATNPKAYQAFWKQRGAVLRKKEAVEAAIEEEHELRKAQVLVDQYKSQVELQDRLAEIQRFKEPTYIPETKTPAHHHRSEHQGAHRPPRGRGARGTANQSFNDRAKGAYQPRHLKPLSDRDIVFNKVRENGLALRDFPEFQNDRGIVLAAIESNPLTLQHASDRLKDDLFVVRQASLKNLSTLQHASPRLKSDKAFMLFMIDRHPQALRFADPNLRSDKTFMDQFKDNRMVMCVAVELNGFMLENVSERLKEDRSLVKLAVKEKGLALQYASPKLKKDLEIVVEAARQNKQALELVDPVLLKNHDFWLELISPSHVQLLELAGAELTDNLIFMEKAICKEPRALAFASPSLKDNEQFMLAALIYNAEALKHASLRLKDSETFLLQGISHNDHAAALFDASDRLKADKAFMLQAIKTNNEAIRYASSNLQADPEIAIAEEESLVSRESRAIHWGRRTHYSPSQWHRNTARSYEPCGIPEYRPILRTKRNNAHAIIAANGLALKDFPEYQDDPCLVESAFTQNTDALQYMGPVLKRNAIFWRNQLIPRSVKSLKYAGENLTGNKTFMLPYIKKDAAVFEYATGLLKTDPDILQAKKEAEKRALRSSNYEFGDCSDSGIEE